MEQQTSHTRKDVVREKRAAEKDGGVVFPIRLFPTIFSGRDNFLLGEKKIATHHKHP